MGFLARLFGDVGTVRFEAETYDGERLTGKCPIESFNNSKAEIEKHLMNALWVEKGIRVKRLTIVGYVENK